MTTPDSEVRGACRRWLRWQDPNHPQDFSIPISRYGDARTQGGEALGAPIEAMRLAQLHYAASQLGPMQRTAAFGRRRLEKHYQVTHLLQRGHGREWRAFMAQHPLRPLAALLDDCADHMATLLDGDP